ncbi:MAG: M20/M25/M40 family metallo-hydrolase [Gammaproteobacteria bacterium]|nr:M20/M25/M40 family metallo-hydrolase [Gammaproteobacteria bacterium]MDH4256084.1 M20/M25/M40 family metallo-hydrolase [Gammaproteobacteria bacterium]MDH5311432.1 M20/M25/M40 family metallo-hydrolase [Gammaproteobacteria bacterium]
MTLSIRHALAVAATLPPLIVPAIGAAQGDVEVDIQSQYVEEIAALRADSRVQAAMEHIVALEPRHRTDLIELTEIPAPPFKEDRRAARFAELLREAGLTDVTIDAVGNAVGRRPGRRGDRIVAYTGHLDTVFPEDTDVTVRFDDDKMYAPGIGDNTRGLVVVLGVLRAMQHAGIETEADILFVGNVGEEGLGDLRGVKHLFREGAEKIDAMIAVDGGESDRIVYGGVGSHRYRITYKGPGGHSWGAFGTANPHHALGRAIALFDQNAIAITASGEKSSYNVGRIGGGTSVNSVPFESWAEIDIRSGDQSKIDAIDAILQAAVEQALQEENADRTEGPELTVDVDRVGTRPAAKGDVSAALVQRALAATSAFGIEPQLRISSTDSNLPISKGIPAVTMSRGGVGGDAHAPGEWWQNKDGQVGIQIGLLTLLAEVGLSK